MNKKWLINIYMLFRHPILFLKYTSQKKSQNFFLYGSSRNIKTNGLSVGKNVRFGYDTRIGFYGRKDNKLIIGEGCYFVNRNTFLVGDNITVGDNCLFASDIFVSSENHKIDLTLDKPYKELELKPVSIGKSCWIGEKVIILPGVSVGNKCIIGAGSVVTKNIPDYSIAVGNPARVIKRYNFNTQKWEKEE